MNCMSKIIRKIETVMKNHKVNARNKHLCNRNEERFLLTHLYNNSVQIK
jgi:hypothetical protein